MLQPGSGIISAMLGATDVELHCSVCASPQSSITTITWTFEGSQLPHDIVIVHSNRALLIRVVNVTHFGRYTCEMTYQEHKIKLDIRLLELGELY